jgi:hypothetical protein
MVLSNSICCLCVHMLVLSISMLLVICSLVLLLYDRLEHALSFLPLIGVLQVGQRHSANRQSSKNLRDRAFRVEIDRDETAVEETACKETHSPSWRQRPRPNKSEIRPNDSSYFILSFIE